MSEAADQFAQEIDQWTPPELDPTIDVFVYGESGAGKTTLVKTLRQDCLENDGRCLHLTVDKGDESILSAVHSPEQWLVPREIDYVNEIRAAISYLSKKDHPFRWVTLDDCTRMASIMNEELKDEYGDDTWGRYDALNTRFRSLLRAVRELDINSLFLAREGTKENGGTKTAAFPGKALGEGDDKSSVLHEFTFGFRQVRQVKEGEQDRFYLQTTATSGAEAKKRDEFHVLDEQETPDISDIRKRWVEAQREAVQQ
jgi:GTPase SAR1 family protein